MNSIVRVLLVEDNPGDADLIMELLPKNRSIRVEVENAVRLSAALDCIRTGQFNIVLLDLGLPDSFGLDTLRAVKLHAEGLPIIVMTGNNDEQTGLDAIREGAQDYLVKGQTDANLLTRSVKYAIERKQAENSLKELNDSLEERVVERTAQISLANTALQTEIAERKRAEESLRRAKEEWERTFDSVPDLIAILDNQHRVLRVNASLARRLGQEPEKCVGLHCYEAVHGTSVPPDFCPHTRTIQDGLEHTEELHVARFGGNFQVTTTPLLDETGERIGSVHIGHDITERKRMEEEQKQFNELLEERIAQRTEELREKDQMLLVQSRQAAMGEMIGNIAHQWRQPLNILGLKIQQLMFYYEIDKFSRELLESSTRSSMELINHMSRTIDDFRNYFKPEREKAEFKLSEAIAGTLSLIEDSFRSQNIRIEVTAKNDPYINGYRSEFAQVILNILNNARDALTEREIDDPRVTISMSSEADKAVITISDNAGGIPEKIREKIFEPYFTTKGPQIGTGVGLFMSKSIIEKNMGGSLTARNIADGAEFRIEV